MNCPPLGDIVATIRSASPLEATRLRVAEGAVGWCAPEVMRLIALNEAAHAPSIAGARLLQAYQLAKSQGARFWMLRIALCMASASVQGDHEAEAVGSIQQLLASIDDGSAVPELEAARTLVGP